MGWGAGNPAGGPIAAPDIRTVCQHTGTIAACPEADKLREKLTNLRHELDDAVDHLRVVSESNAGLAKWAGAYQAERDESAEEADEWRNKAERYLETIDELQAENRGLTADLATARSERDTANAKASL